MHETSETNEISEFTALGELIHYKNQAIGLYNQASKIMFGHIAAWSYRLREMGAHSQGQHDALCCFTVGNMEVRTISSFFIVEHPEAKDELALQCLEVLILLEKKILAIPLEEKDAEWNVRSHYAQSISEQNLQMLEWMYRNFHARFVTTKDKTARCALCGYWYLIDKGETCLEQCPMCDAKNAIS